MKLDKHVVDMFTELTKPADDVKMEKTCYGTISVVDGTRYVKLDGSDLLVPAASTVKTWHGDRVTVLMKNHSLTVTGNLTSPSAVGGGGGSSGGGGGGSSGGGGTAATIKVGTVTTGEAGSSASVTNSGTTSAAVFDFVIPRGDKGEKGDPGPQGPQGEKGDTGTWDGTIPEHDHTVSDITDFPTSLPANGGNADTLDGLHANEIASNPNLFINSWFGNGVINQRGQTIYPAVSGASNTIDCWKTIDNFDLTVNDGFITLSNGDSLWHKYFNQSIKGLKRFAGQAVTISAKVRWSNGDYYLVGGKHIDYPGSDWQIVSHTIIMPDTDELSYIYGGYGVAGSIDIMWIKLELGSVATPFIPPNPTEELLKIQSMDDSGIPKLVSNDTLPTIMNSQMVSNPNLLINPDFEINQRGQSIYHDGIAMDRWIAESAITVSKNSDGTFTIESSAGPGSGFYQQLENYNELVGKTVTLSLCAKGSGSIALCVNGWTADIIIVTLSDEYKVFNATFTISGAYNAVGFYAFDGTNTASVTPKWIKLELGNIATLFCPPDHATELLKIQAMDGNDFISTTELAFQSICPSNVFLYDNLNSPSVMVKIPKMTWAQLGVGDSTEVFPAFIVNGQVVDALYFSKYENIVRNNRGYSLPAQDPADFVDHDQSVTYSTAKGAGWHSMTRLEWCVIALWCLQNGFQPNGNNNFGKDISESTYKAIPTVYYSDGRTQRVATGTGPLTWYHNNAPDGIADMNGNVWEWTTGVRLVYGELQVLSHDGVTFGNDAAHPANSQAADSALWRAIDGTTGALITPDGSGTTANSLKLDFTSSGWKWVTGTISSKQNSNRYAEFESTTVDSTVCVAAQRILQALCLYKANDTVGAYKNDGFWGNNGAAETLFFAGGDWTGSVGAGVFVVHCCQPRSNSGGYLGFRSAFVNLPTT